MIDKPFIMALVGKAITLGLAIASAVVGYNVNAPAWSDGIPLIVGTAVIALIHRNYSNNAQQSYGQQLQAGIVQSPMAPVGVGSGPPGELAPAAIVGPEREVVPRGPMPGADGASTTSGGQRV